MRFQGVALSVLSASTLTAALPSVKRDLPKCGDPGFTYISSIRPPPSEPQYIQPYSICDLLSLNYLYIPWVPFTYNWCAPPSDFTFGNWWIAYSSKTDYQGIFNFQWQHNPAPSPAPALDTVMGPIINKYAPYLEVDLSAFQLPPSYSNVTITNYGYDAFPLYDKNVLAFYGTGHFNQVKNVVDLVGWGCDSTGKFLVYWDGPLSQTNETTPTPPGVTLMAQNKNGVEASTLTAIRARYNDWFLYPELVNNATAMVAPTGRLHVDDRKSQNSPIICNSPLCYNNLQH